MKKTVLIPTDFSVHSLNTLKSFLNNSTDKNIRYDIILLHGYALPSGIPDLLFFSKGKTLDSLSGKEFEEACVVIKNKFASIINSIRTDLFTGSTNAAFANYIEANEVSEICFNSSLHSEKTSKNSFDLTKYINKSNTKLIEIAWNTEIGIDASTENNISAVFTNTSITVN